MLKGLPGRLLTAVATRMVARILPELDAEFARFRLETTERLHTELAALRAELQAERATFAHGLEQLRQSQAVGLQHELERGRETGVSKLAETLDAALLTLALNGQPGAAYRSSSVSSPST